MPAALPLEDLSTATAAGGATPLRDLREKLGTGAVRFLERMVSVADRQGRISLNRTQLATLSGHKKLSERTVQRHISTLQKAGILADIPTLQLRSTTTQLPNSTTILVPVDYHHRTEPHDLASTNKTTLTPSLTPSLTLRQNNDSAHLEPSLSPPVSAVDSTNPKFTLATASKHPNVTQLEHPKPQAFRASDTRLTLPSLEACKSREKLSLACARTRAYINYKYIPKGCTLFSSTPPEEEKKYIAPQLAELAGSKVCFIFLMQGQPENLTPKEPDPLTPKDKQLLEDLADIGSILAKPGRSNTKALSHCHHPSVPAYPGSTLLRVAKVPAPPLLPNTSSEARIRMLASTYHAAVNAKYARTSRVKCGTFYPVLKLLGRAKPGSKAEEKLHRSQHYRLLKYAAEQLFEHKIPPASWVSFALDVWVEYGDASRDRSQPPLPQYVFAKKHFEKWRGWFWSESGRYHGGKLIFSDHHRELLQRWDDMRAELRTLPDEPTDEEVEAVVESHFPDDTYEQLLTDANEHADSTTEKLKRMLARGVFLWNDEAWEL